MRGFRDGNSTGGRAYDTVLTTDRMIVHAWGISGGLVIFVPRTRGIHHYIYGWEHDSEAASGTDAGAGWTCFSCTLCDRAEKDSDDDTVARMKRG